ncbi:hypothetical protein HK102_003790 [Quaeritorhiza haematococci]|nr:hypothetical protein HK102_003790 [Quaeritorhiza haematococci]
MFLVNVRNFFSRKHQRKHRKSAPPAQPPAQRPPIDQNIVAQWPERVHMYKEELKRLQTRYKQLMADYPPQYLFQAEPFGMSHEEMRALNALKKADGQKEIDLFGFRLKFVEGDPADRARAQQTLARLQADIESGVLTPYKGQLPSEHRDFDLQPLDPALLRKMQDEVHAFFRRYPKATKLRRKDLLNNPLGVSVLCVPNPHEPGAYELVGVTRDRIGGGTMAVARLGFKLSDPSRPIVIKRSYNAKNPEVRERILFHNNREYWRQLNTAKEEAAILEQVEQAAVAGSLTRGRKEYVFPEFEPGTMLVYVPDRKSLLPLVTNELARLRNEYGVVHLDPHPCNVIVSPDRTRVKLIDYNIAKNIKNRNEREREIFLDKDNEMFKYYYDDETLSLPPLDPSWE